MFTVHCCNNKKYICGFFNVKDFLFYFLESDQDVLLMSTLQTCKIPAQKNDTCYFLSTIKKY